MFRSIIYCILYCFRLETKTAYENNLIETESIRSLKMDWYNKPLTECTSVALASNIRLWHHNSFHAEIPFDICMWGDFSTRRKFPQVKQMPRKYTSVFWFASLKPNHRALWNVKSKSGITWERSMALSLRSIGLILCGVLFMERLQYGWITLWFVNKWAWNSIELPEWLIRWNYATFYEKLISPGWHNGKHWIETSMHTYT